MSEDRLDILKTNVRRFAAERDWDQFHTPKNLAMALTAEAGELAAEFQWMDGTASLRLDAEHLARVQDEAADVLIYLVRLADRLSFDLLDAASAKMERNAVRYPVALAKGSAKKHNQF